MASRSKKPLSCRGASSIWSFKRAPIVALAMFLAACGFTPIHKFDAAAPPLNLAALQVSGDAIARGLRRALAQRVSLNQEAGLRVEIDVSRTQRDAQKTVGGEALRLELRHQALVRVSRDHKTDSARFQLTQFMTRGDSGADELNQIRALDDLAIRDLSAKILGYLATQNRSEAAR